MDSRAVTPAGPQILATTFLWQYQVAIDADTVVGGKVVESRLCKVTVDCVDRDHPHGNYEIAGALASRIVAALTDAESGTAPTVMENPGRSFWEPYNHRTVRVTDAKR